MLYYSVVSCFNVWVLCLSRGGFHAPDAYTTITLPPLPFSTSSPNKKGLQIVLLAFKTARGFFLRFVDTEQNFAAVESYISCMYEYIDDALYGFRVRLES